ncbi:MAG: hypothetical protein KGH88_09340, partial [Thaumarchaeota archaeon]|nr:hypothetical protein [Nitrososphaerota archaeon]
MITDTKDKTMRDLYNSLSSQGKSMSTELDAVKSFLMELRQELELIRTIYGDEEVMSIMKKAEDTRFELDLVKPDMEALRSVLYELKSMLPVPNPEEQPATTLCESAKPANTLNPEHEQSLAALDALKSELQSTRSIYDSEIKSIIRRSEDARLALDALNSEYRYRMDDLQAARTEIASLGTQRESLLREISALKSELESARSLYNSDEIQLIKGKIDSIKSELSGLEEEKKGAEDNLGDVQSQTSLARSELAKVLSKVDGAKSELDLKNKDIRSSKRELEFIERELALVHEKDEMRKIVKASSAMVAEANAKCLGMAKELEILQKL